MLFAFFTVLLCCSHAYGASPLEWKRGVEKIRVLNAKKAIETGKPQESDYDIMGLGDLAAEYNMDEVLRGYLISYSPSFESSIGDTGAFIVASAMKRNEEKTEFTYQGSFPGEPQHYNYYRLKKSCGSKVVVQKTVEEYKGDESNDVTIWIINEMSKNLNVTFTLDTEKSQTLTTGRSHAYETSVGATIGAEGFGVKAALSTKASYKSDSEQKDTVINTDKKSTTYETVVGSNRAIKMMRYVKMRKVTTRYETSCHLSGFIGVKMQGSGDNRWFLPVSEMAKVLRDFVLDDDKPDTVIFKYSNTEVSSRLNFVKKTSGFETKDIVENLPKME